MCTIQELERICDDFYIEGRCVGEFPTIHMTISMADLNKIHLADAIIRAINGSILSKQRTEDSNNE